MTPADRPDGPAADSAEPADAKAMRELLAKARVVSRRIMERIRRVNPEDKSPDSEPPPPGDVF